MKERTFESGGEILREGDTVIVFDGNSQKKMTITQIGTRRVHIESAHGQPIPYSLETRQSLQGAYITYFRTKTEVAEYARRDAVRSRLRDLGVDLYARGIDSAQRYPLEVLEQVAGILEANTPK